MKRRKYSLEFDYTIDYEVRRVDLIVEVYFTPGSPGRYDALPEDCFPDEPAEIDSIKLRRESDDSIFPWEELSISDQEAITNEALEEINASQDEPREPEDAE